MRGFRFRSSLKKCMAARVFGLRPNTREAPRRTREKTSGTQGNVYRSRVRITLLLVRVGFVNMM